MLYHFGPNTRIVISPAAAVPVRRAAAYLQRQVERRSGWRWEVVQESSAAPGDVVLGVTGDGTPGAGLTPEYPEEIALSCSGDPAAPTALALAGSPGVALAAAGRLARLMGLRPGVAALPGLSLREHPAFPVRGQTLANHKQNNTHDKWAWGHWEEYVTELAAWGQNTLIAYPLHPERWHGVLPFDEPPWFATPNHEAEWRRQMAIQARLPQLCRDLGMRYGLWSSVNDVFHEEARRHPEITRLGGAYVCPNIPEGRRRIRALRDRIFAMLPHLDVLVLPSRDNGGCPSCPDCTPWARTYLELVREQIEQAHRYHPECVVWLGLQGLSPSEGQEVLDWLDRERPDWVEAVELGPYSELMSHGDRDSALSTQPYSYGGHLSGPPNRLRAALPGRYRMVLYPDVTHTFRCQYPVVGMDPAVQLVWDRENGPSIRPLEMAALHAATCPPSDGSAPYSEGNHDDVNKFVWAALDWSPGRTGEDVAGEYARWFFGEANTHDAVQIMVTVERALNGPLYDQPAVAEARGLLDACEARDPALLENWRWLNLRLGVLMLDHIQRALRRDRRIAAELRYRVPSGADLDASPFLRDGIRYLERELGATDGLLREIVWTRDRLFALQWLAIRGVASLQQSYMRLDVLLERWKELLGRIERGELDDPRERRAALVAAMQGFEDSVRLATKGIGLVEHLQEYAWEHGPTDWR